MTDPVDPNLNDSGWTASKCARPPFNLSERHEVVVLLRDGGVRSIRGPGKMIGPADSGTLVLSGFEHDRKIGFIVSLLNPNIVGVEINNLPIESI